MSKRIGLWLDAVVKAGVTPKARLVCFSLAMQIMTKGEYSGGAICGTSSRLRGSCW